jgi:hypothetical protein
MGVERKLEQKQARKSVVGKIPGLKKRNHLKAVELNKKNICANHANCTRIYIRQII